MCDNDIIVGNSETYQMNENQKCLLFYSTKKFVLVLDNLQDISNVTFICCGKNCIQKIGSNFALENYDGHQVFLFPQDLHIFLKAKYFKFNFCMKLFYLYQNFATNYHDLLSKFHGNIMKIYEKIPICPRYTLFILFSLPYSTLTSCLFILPYQIFTFILFSPFFSKLGACIYFDLTLFGPIMPLLLLTGIPIRESTAQIYPPKIKFLSAILKIPKQEMLFMSMLYIILILCFRLLSLIFFNFTRIWPH